MEKELKVKTPLGQLVVELEDEPKCPGVSIHLEEEGVRRVLLSQTEFCDGDIRTHIYADGEKEEPTQHVVYKNLGFVMRQLELDALTIETTRSCNMNCAHCFLGDAEEKYMEMETLQPLLDRVAGIRKLIFTGGEPSKNVSIMRDTLRYVKENKIRVNSFVIETNAKEVSDLFVLLCCDWYAHCCTFGMAEGCEVRISIDEFHERVDQANLDRLGAFSFTKICQRNHREAGLISSGHAENLTHTDYWMLPVQRPSMRVEKMELESGFPGYCVESLYISTDGSFLVDGVMAYRDMKKFCVGTIRNMEQFLQFLDTCTRF